MAANFIAPQFWDAKKLVELGACAKFLFGCMICGPQISKVPGLFRGTPATFYKSMRPFSPVEVEDAFKRILAKGIAIFDEDEEVIRLPKVNKHHLPPNPKQIIGWRRGWSELPETKLKYDHLDTLEKLAKRADSGPKAWKMYFGGIVIGDPSTHAFNRSWIPEDRGGKKPSRNPTGYPTVNGTDMATGELSPGEKKNRGIYFLEEGGSEEEEDPDTDTDPDTESDPRFRDGIGKGIDTGSVPVGKDSDERRNGAAERPKSDRAAPAQSGSAPRLPGSAEGSPGDADDDLSRAGRAGGRGGHLAVVPVSPKPIKSRYRHD